MGFFYWSSHDILKMGYLRFSSTWIVLKISAHLEKCQYSKKRKTEILMPALWCGGLLMILTRFPEEWLPQIFLKMKRSQDLGPSWKMPSQQKTKNINIGASPIMWGSFKDPRTISWRGVTTNFPQNEAFTRSRPILKKRRVIKNVKLPKMQEKLWF